MSKSLQNMPTLSNKIINFQYFMQDFPRSKNRENPTGIRDLKKLQQGRVSASGCEKSDQVISQKTKLQEAAKAGGCLHPIVLSTFFSVLA